MSVWYTWDISVRLIYSRILEVWQQRRNSGIKASGYANNLLASPWSISAWCLIEMISVPFGIHHADTQHWVTNSKDRPVHLVLYSIWEQNAQDETYSVIKLLLYSPLYSWYLQFFQVIYLQHHSSYHNTPYTVLFTSLCYDNSFT